MQITDNRSRSSTSSFITIFSIPKSFEGREATLQENALASWARLDGVDIFLFGDEPGIAERAEEFGARHEPRIERTPEGTPLVGRAISHAEKMTTTPLLCYVNMDILLFEDFLGALRNIALRRFLAVGRRWNVDVEGRVDFSTPEATDSFRATARATGRPETPFGSDYFAYPRGIPWRFPPFVVGRPPWDNWFIFRARELRIPVIDISPSVLVVHQNHGYEHVPGKRSQTWEGPEADYNRALLPHPAAVADLNDATHILEGGRRKLAAQPRHLRARLLMVPKRHPKMKPLFGLCRTAYRRLKTTFSATR